MSTYAVNREWSDQFIPHIKRIVGFHLLQVTPHEIDCKQATDLMVFTARDLRIAARVRRPGFAERYPFQFTLRASQPSGAETELSKMINGWGDWLFYGHSTDDERAISLFWILDLNAFRAALIRRHQAAIRSGVKPNNDGTTFRWFDITSFPDAPPLVVATNHQGYRASRMRGAA